MVTDKSVGVNHLSFDLQSLELIARASYLLTLRDRKQRKLQQVLALMLESTPNLDAALIMKVEAQRPLAGDAVLGVRLDKRQQARAEFIKTSILKDFGYQWQLRDVVIYLCRSLIEKFT